MSQTIRKAKALLVRKEAVEWAKSLLAKKEIIEPAKPVFVQTESINKQDKSKLMICVEILCILVANGPMKLTWLCDKFEIGDSNLEPYMKLLWNRGLVEEENFGDNETHYVVSERGLKVLKVIGPILKEAHKIQMHNFEAVMNALSGADIP